MTASGNKRLYNKQTNEQQQKKQQHDAYPVSVPSRPRIRESKVYKPPKTPERPTLKQPTPFVGFKQSTHKPYHVHFPRYRLSEGGGVGRDRTRQDKKGRRGYIYIDIYVNVRIRGFTYDSCGEIITLAGRMRFQRYGFGFVSFFPTDR